MPTSRPDMEKRTRSRLKKGLQSDLGYLRQFQAHVCAGPMRSWDARCRRSYIPLLPDTRKMFPHRGDTDSV